jgi:uncharacterized repeat protein (TIGR03803 family)
LGRRFVAADDGTVFWDPPGGSLTTLYTFTGVNGDGANPYGALIQAADGNLYGTIFSGGASYSGAIFKMTLAGAVTTIYSFDGTDADRSYSGLVQGRDGKLYGTTYYGGATGESAGTVFSLSLASTSAPLPSVSAGGVVSASSFGEFTSVAHGSWIEIYGSNLASDTRSWASRDFNGINAPTAVDGTSVTIGGQPAFVAFISPGQ